MLVFFLCTSVSCLVIYGMQCNDCLQYTTGTSTNVFLQIIPYFRKKIKMANVTTDLMTTKIMNLTTHPLTTEMLNLTTHLMTTGVTNVTTPWQSTTEILLTDTTSTHISSTAAPPEFSEFWGFIMAGIAVLFYGSNFVPIKKFETGDGKNKDLYIYYKLHNVLVT